MIKILLLIIILVTFLILLWFIQPYSPLQSYFWKLDKKLLSKNTKSKTNFELSQLTNLPLPIQNFFCFSGFIGKPVMSSTITVHSNADFILNEGKPSIKIKYIQNNYAHTPERIAFIDTKMYKIPFQGMDTYVDGTGSMKGVLAKLICLFDQKSKEMDISSLVTVLAESIICPSAFLLDCITWETLDNTHVRATIEHNGITASGIYTFSEEGAILSFKTNERYEIDTNGNTVCTPWTAECGNYIEVNGIKSPTSFKATWNRKNEDLVYFNCNNITIKYRY